MAGAGNDKLFKLAANVVMEMSPNLVQFLNLTKTTYDNRTSAESKIIKDINPIKVVDYPSPWQHNIYIICEGIEESYVNNSTMKVLGSIQLSTDLDYGSYIDMNVNSPIFRKFTDFTKIDQITIKMVDENGNSLKQLVGSSWVALLIRKIK